MNSADSASIQELFDQEPLDQFWKFINERQWVWFRRVVENRPKPWTRHQILRDYRFTNVYRELDPGTQYSIQKILEVDASKPDKILNIMLYRLIGRSKTHDYLGFQTIDNFDSTTFEERLKFRRDKLDEPVFTGAYMVSGYTQMGSSDKIENITKLFANIASNDAFFANLLGADSMKDAYKILNSQPGFGNFLSYQVLVDLLYPVNYYGNQSVLPFSHNEWSSPGPGAKKGIKRIVPDLCGYDMLDIMRWLQRNQRDEFNRLNLDFPYLLNAEGKPLSISLANIQNCLCEFYKFHKILNSEGRARRRFKNSEARKTVELREVYEQAPNIKLPCESRT